jgi:hypothetical protein
MPCSAGAATRAGNWSRWNLDADLKGTRDGHLLIFKRQVGGASVAEARGEEREAIAEASEPWARGWADAARAAGEEE